MYIVATLFARSFDHLVRFRSEIVSCSPLVFVKAETLCRLLRYMCILESIQRFIACSERWNLLISS
jgi:hypothetical protein